MATATLNGKPQRKQLGDQLDRLDSIIDALAEGLPGAVADACRDGARLAVKDAIIEIISNPELRALLSPPPASAPSVPVSPPEPKPMPEPKPGFWKRFTSKAKAASNAVVGAALKAKNSVVDRCKTARDTIVAVGTAAGEAMPTKQISLVALGVGVVVGVACLVVPQTVAAVVGAVGAAATAVSVQVGGWLKRAAGRFGLVS
ncbi:MAG: hypothetical protein C0467_29525 [Planctomycetaceae bacterium]|nr:hypothetical protein [Planctomycetaceae bacterium]